MLMSNEQSYPEDKVDLYRLLPEGYISEPEHEFWLGLTELLEDPSIESLMDFCIGYAGLREWQAGVIATISSFSSKELLADSFKHTEMAVVIETLLEEGMKNMQPSRVGALDIVITSVEESVLWILRELVDEYFKRTYFLELEPDALDEYASSYLSKWWQYCEKFSAAYKAEGTFFFHN